MWLLLALIKIGSFFCQIFKICALLTYSFGFKERFQIILQSIWPGDIQWNARVNSCDKPSITQLAFPVSYHKPITHSRNTRWHDDFTFCFSNQWKSTDCNMCEWWLFVDMLSSCALTFRLSFPTPTRLHHTVNWNSITYETRGLIAGKATMLCQIKTHLS